MGEYMETKMDDLIEAGIQQKNIEDKKSYDALEYVIFDMDWQDIPIQDYPVGHLAICHDPQKRLGKITWAVVKVISEDPPPKALGLFWDKEEAIRYAKSFT